eukprot:jgi/Mesen1/9907/ME000070S09194
MEQFMGWYSRLQRDEVLAVWKRAKSGAMALHVHCHISGGHLMHNIIARLRFWIFRKELPVVLEAFRHGDRDLFKKHPDLEHAPVWVHFHSNLPQFNKHECWGPLLHAAEVGAAHTHDSVKEALQAAICSLESVVDDMDRCWPLSDAPYPAGPLIPTPYFPEEDASASAKATAIEKELA